MSLPTQIDHVKQGLNRVLSQWENSPNIQGLFKSYLEQMGVLEDVLFQLLEERGIYEAIGVQLDVIGALFDEDRKSRTDEQYRTGILKQIALLQSDGTTEVLMQAFRTATASNFVDFIEHPSGDVHAWLGDGYNHDTFADLRPLVAAGVNFRIYADFQFDSFIADEVIQIPSTLEIDTLDTIEVQDELSNKFDLQVQAETIASEVNAAAILPEIPDKTLETPFLAELLFAPVNRTSDFFVDSVGDNIVDGDGNNIVWVEYSF